MILALGTIAPALPAAAQTYRSGPNARVYDGPPPGYWIFNDDDDAPVRRPGARYRERSAQSGTPGRGVPDNAEPDPRLPSPGFAVPSDQRPLEGHQLNQPSAPVDIVRPPAPVGNAPALAAAPSGAPGANAALPPEDQPETGEPKELPPELKKQLVDYPTKEPAGTLIVDTGRTYLYLVLGNGKAMRYGIGVGREGFTWAGSERVSKMAEWPDWHPPAEMIERQPYLPRFMAGGPGNPLGARALYLGKTLYRIHGTNQPSTIGSYVSSGCIRLLNGDIEDLYSRVQVGTRVVVLPSTKSSGPPPTDLTAPISTSANAGPASQLPPPVTGSGGTSSIQSSPLPPLNARR